MRTKQILTALALPALFAACTADDFESISNGAEQQRAALRKDLVLNFDGANTRFSAGAPDAAPNLVWEVGDTIGGAIIDQYAPGQSDEFPVVDYVSTNHPFVLGADGVWGIKHTMVEGHYLFYYPYNKNNHERGAVKYSIPVMQDLSDPETGEFNPKAAIERYNMAIGEQFLDKEDLNAGTMLLNLYSYARVKVTIDNHYAGGNVDKIVLEAANNEEFALNGQISNKKVAELFSDGDFDEVVKTKNATADFCLDGKETPKFYDEELNKGSKVIVAKFPANTALKVDGQNNKSIETYVVLPAANYGVMKVYMYMADGKVYDGEIAAFTANRNKIKGLEVMLDTAEKAPYVVTSEADWNRYVSLIKKGEEAKFTIAGEDFSLSNNAKYPTAEGASVNVAGNLKVSGNNVTMANVKAETITVLEGAKLNVNDQITAKEIINEGEVVLEKVVKNSVVTEIESVKEITNKGTLTVKEDAKADFTLNNEKGAKIENDGEITIDGYNKGEINNRARINTTGFTNESREYNAKGDKVINTPTINNAENANILAESGELTNKADIVNSGVLTCRNSEGTIVNGKDEKNNAAVLDSKSGAITYITGNGDGKVIVYSANTTNLTISGEKGIVEYTTSNAAETFKGSLVNTVIASKSLEIKETEAGGLKSLTFNGDATLKLGKKADGTFTASIKKLIVNGGKTTLGTDLTLETVTIVAKNAMVIIPEKLTMTITGDAIKNEGTILVGGKLVAENIQKGAEGNGRVEDNGGKGDVTWAKTDDDKNKEAYENAVAGVVNAWIENITMSGWNDLTAAALANGTWTGTDKWIVDAAGAFVEAYNAYFKTEISKATMKNAITERATDFEAAIEAAKATANRKVTETIKANIKDNGWLLDNGTVRAYMKKTADATLTAIVDATNGTMTAAFVDAVKEISEANAGSKAVWLSLQDFVEGDVVADMIPDYSYINVYETSDEYKAMKLWRSAGEEFKDEDWYKNDTELKKYPSDKANVTMMDMKKFFNKINMKDTTGDLLLGQQLAQYKAIAATVIGWNYDNTQIVALAAVENP